MVALMGVPPGLLRPLYGAGLPRRPGRVGRDAGRGDTVVRLAVRVAAASERATWTTFLPGAALLAIGLQLMRIATSVYFVGRLERVNDLYGSIGLATVFMVWLFLIGRLVVAAMALNAERWRATTAVVDATPGGGDESP